MIQIIFNLIELILFIIMAILFKKILKEYKNKLISIKYFKDTLEVECSHKKYIKSKDVIKICKRIEQIIEEVE